jgi:hypothetical protein
MAACANVLGGRFVQGQINGTGCRAAVQPAIGVDANGLARELLEVAWLVDRFQ